MKTILRRALVLLLCISFSLGLVPTVFAAEELEAEENTEYIELYEEYAAPVEETQDETPLSETEDEAPQRSLFMANSCDSSLCAVRFYSEKGYDLVGLLVSDAAGATLEPETTGDGWTYLLAPGVYTYRYHDERDIFADLEETVFTLEGTLEIPLTLSAAFEDRFDFSMEINPLYADLIGTAALDVPAYTREEALDDMIEWRIAESERASADGGQKRPLLRALSADAQVRNAMTARQEKITVSFYSSTPWTRDDVVAKYNEVKKEAVKHTGDHRQGDTLTWAYYKSGWDAVWNNWDSQKQQYRHDIKFIFYYRTTAAQEQIVCDTVESMAAGLAGLSDYQKAYAINEWLYQNVDYDYEHEGNTAYHPQFTDYAALISRIAVCHGFAISFYRLALAAGLDARFVSSTSMHHAWNIVNIDGLWYELDATWDSNRRQKGEPASELPHYFLRGSTWWANNHGNGQIGDQFNYSPTHSNYDPSFATYTLSQTDYVPEEPATYIVSYNANGGDSAPESQVKVHGTDLTLTTELPTRANPADVTYTVILYGNGGTIALDTNPEATAVRYKPVKKTSYSFIVWNTATNGSGTSYMPGALYDQDANMELFARWKRTTSTQTVSLPTPTKEGYYFVGWGTSRDATTGITGRYIPESDANFYAVWVQPDFVMPDALTNIEEEAFAGCAFSFVKLSENTANIGPRAFADCPNLKYIYIPEGATVDPTAFENVEGLTVFSSAA